MANQPSMTLDQLQEKYRGRVPVPIVAVARDLGMDVCVTDEFDDAISGSLSKEDGAYTIYVNQKHPVVRQRFTIAHEIGHFLYHQSHFDTVTEHLDAVKQPIEGDSVPLFRQDTLPLSDEQRKMEIEANAAAAELLMPKGEFTKAWAITHDVEGIAEKFRVSQSAAAIRAKTLFGETFI